MSPAVSSTRWCPTPEQLMILEEMYRSGGIRTPNASQIQQITAHLSYYGRIEGKNVFYWFQNHKARDRQKLRRKLSKQLHHHHHHHQQQPQPQHQQNQQNLHHHLLYYLDQSHTASSPTPPPPPPPPLSSCTPATFLPQGGFHEDNNASSTKVMNYTWKVDIAPEMEKQKQQSMMRMYGRDWTMMMMMDVGPISHCQNRPLKTLELFPITATNLKDDECNNTSPPNKKPCSTPFLHGFPSLSLSPP